MAFGFSNMSIHGVQKIIAVSRPGHDQITLIFVSDDGEEVEIDAYLSKQVSYASDAALALNRTADDYGFLSDDERKDLLPDTLLLAAE